MSTKHERTQETVRLKIKKFYGLNRKVTDDEIKQEIVMLKRHLQAGTLDDLNMELYCRLVTGTNPIESYQETDDGNTNRKQRKDNNREHTNQDDNRERTNGQSRN